MSKALGVRIPTSQFFKPVGVAKWVERPPPVLGEDCGFESKAHGFETWSSQTKDFKMDTCCFLAWRLELLRYGKDWLAQCQDKVTESDNRSWCLRPGVPVRQHYQVTMSVHCHKSVPILIWPYMLLRCKTITTNKNIFLILSIWYNIFVNVTTQTFF